MKLHLPSLLGTTLLLILAVISCTGQTHKSKVPYFIDSHGDTIYKVVKTDAEWRQELDSMAYLVLREEGTEIAFTGAYWDTKSKGVYACGGCGLGLFDSKTKFRSGTGWPSFYAPIDLTYVKSEADYKLGIPRTEVICQRCGGHLGHVFEDGPQPTGLRYCLNSAALSFEPEQ